MGSRKIESFDVPRKTREIIEWKAARRKQLRAKYLELIHNPVKQQTPVDDAFNRYSALKIGQQYISKVNSRIFITAGLGFYGIVSSILWLYKSSKDREENLIRTGQISYADRRTKF